MDKRSKRMFRVGVLAILLAALAAGERGVAQGGVITVTTTAQGINILDGFCSLQEAIYSANFDDNWAIAQSDPIDPANPDVFVRTECTPGSGDDTIVLPASYAAAGLAFQMGSITFDPHNYMGPTATPIIFTNITIEANGNRLEHLANGIAFRAFAVGTATIDLPAGSASSAVSGTGNLTIRNAHIRGFTTKGGNAERAGADGAGGGGMGAGGAIYVERAGLVVDSSTFEANGAVGGNGGHIDHQNVTGNSGGGGLSGNGALGVRGAGGGGGGARGEGGRPEIFGAGGGGGGTVANGADGASGIGGAGGVRCGGDGGDVALLNNGDDGRCAGGGGGGGADEDEIFQPFATPGIGGNGNYGGGGGGGSDAGDGGNGGFGGGGGGQQGGDSTFGGGGGGSGAAFPVDPPAGKGGSFGGDGGVFPNGHGGGGAGLGGAIFNHAGVVIVRNSTFTANFAVRGLAGGPGAAQGQDAGGAIFSVAGSLTVLSSTISGNETTGEGGGVAVYKPTTGEATTFALHNTIVANNGNRECFFMHSVATLGSGNLIELNAAGEDPNPADDLGPRFACPGRQLTAVGDPQLGPLQINTPGLTPTMAIGFSSPAFNQADPGTSLVVDQRGVARPAGGAPDIGAYEYLTNPDFSLHSFTQVTATPGGTGSTQLIVHSIEGFNSLVKLEPATVPAGFSLSFSPDVVTPAPNNSPASTLTVSVDPSVAAGTYAVTVRGIAGAHLFHDLSIVVTVEATAESVINTIRSFEASGAIDSQGISFAFTTKVALARTFADTGQIQSAVNILYALSHQIKAQAGKHITDSVAAVLTADVIDLQGRLGGNVRADPVMGMVVNASGAPVAEATVSILSSANKVIASAATDATGFYVLAKTTAFAAGSSYTVKVSPAKPYKSSTPASLAFRWTAVPVVLQDFVVN